MKKVLKITVILIMIFTIFTQVSMVYAAPSSSNVGGKSLNPNYWKPQNNSGGSLLQSRAKVITTAIRSVGIVISVIVLMIIGIKQMTASVEEKSILKQAMPGYIIGAIMVFAITVIPTIIYEMVNNIF